MMTDEIKKEHGLVRRKKDLHIPFSAEGSLSERMNTGA